MFFRFQINRSGNSHWISYQRPCMVQLETVWGIWQMVLLLRPWRMGKYGQSCWVEVTACATWKAEFTIGFHYQYQLYASHDFRWIAMESCIKLSSTVVIYKIYRHTIQKLPGHWRVSCIQVQLHELKMKKHLSFSWATLHIAAMHLSLNILHSCLFTFYFLSISLCAFTVFKYLKAKLLLVPASQ